MVYNYNTNRIFFHPGYEVPYIDLYYSIPQGTYATLTLFKNVPDIDKKIFEMAGLPPTRRVFPSPLVGEQLPKFPHPLAVIVKCREMQIFFMLKFRHSPKHRFLLPRSYAETAPQIRKFKSEFHSRLWREYKTTYYYLRVARALEDLPPPLPLLLPPLPVHWQAPRIPPPLPPLYWRPPLQLILPPRGFYSNT